MTSALIALVLALFAGMSVPVERAPLAGSSFEYDASGAQRVGAMACWPGPRPVVYYSEALTEEGEAHEYVHAGDCSDDGLLNGSVCGFTRPATFEAALMAVHQMRPGVLSSAAVWYAWAGTMGDEPVDTADAEWCAVISVLAGSLVGNQEVREWAK